MEIDRTELRQGMRETRKYLLSHHVQSELYRCYAPVVLGKQVHICARCSGVYPGIVVGLGAYFTTPIFTHLSLVLLLPLPAMLDWCTTSFTDLRGSNVVRTLTGALLGYSYGLGILFLVVEKNLMVLIVGLFYALSAGGLIFLRDRIGDNELGLYTRRSRNAQK